ncbi:MAG: methyltransferase domain-containing protein [archaeon]
MSYYDSIADGYDNLHKEEQLKKLDIIRVNLPIEKGDALLDVGCGTGFSHDVLECNWTGLDPSKKLLDKAKGRVVLGKAEAMPFPDKSFDVVISVTAIHNFEDVEKGLREMKRVGDKRFAFGVLKKSDKFASIKKLIEEMFDIKKTIEEEKDLIFFVY